MRIVVLLNVFVADLDVFIEIGGPKANHADIKFIVAALEILIQFRFGKGNASCEKFLNFFQANLIAHELFDVLFSKTERRQRVLHKLIEFIDIESRLALKGRQLAHDIGNLRSAWPQSQAPRFMPKDQQVNDELDSALLLVR